MSIESISAREMTKAPAWLITQLEQWGKRRSAGRAGHALIVTSEDVEEATLFCHLFASQQFCVNTSNTSACGQCRGCRSLRQGVHGDFTVVRRSEGKTAIGIDQIRQATQSLQQTALYGSIKIVLIESADKMTLAAANSILKVLEEPPGNALVLLTTAAIWQLPPTVRSRCQRLSLTPPAQDQAMSWLTTEGGLNSGTAMQAWEISQGKAVLALMLGDDESLSSRQALVQSFDQLDRNAGPPPIWSKISATILLGDLLSWVEMQSRAALQDNPSAGSDWLRLHSCLGELYWRLLRGATPAPDILVSEVYRLCKSRGHVSFKMISGRFLAGLGRVDSTG